MELSLTRKQLQEVLSHVGVSFSTKHSTEALKKLFSDNRSIAEDALKESASVIFGKEKPDGLDEQFEDETTEDFNKPTNTDENFKVLNEVTKTTNSEIDALDEEIEILRRRHEVLRLRKEIENMELNTTYKTPERRVNFQDIEHAIVKFSGEDRTFGVKEFFQNIEEVLEQVKADDLLKFLTLRNSLTGSARLILNRGALTYEDLKAKLIKEFGHTVAKKFTIFCADE